jgi:hypothetical protein
MHWRPDPDRAFLEAAEILRPAYPPSRTSDRRCRIKAIAGDMCFVHAAAGSAVILGGLILELVHGTLTTSYWAGSLLSK